MRRKIISQLETWRSSTNRKPLILEGARQVGKTYSVMEFAKSNYVNLVYFNLEKDAQAASMFEGSIDPKTLLGLFELRARQKIDPQTTLIFIDEIQGARRALTSLKYFCEEAPQYSVIAAGSVLGLALARDKVSYPVGKVDVLRLYPMDFEEFLWALDEENAVDYIRECAVELRSCALHETMLEYYRLYLVCGGMPEAVLRYSEERDPEAPGRVHEVLQSAYIADMAKYAPPEEAIKIVATWQSLANQLLKENRKFQYSVINKGARSQQFLYPLAWLDAAFIVNRCTLATDGMYPLAAFKEPDFFKMFLADTGMLSTMMQVAPQDIILDTIVASRFVGSLAENYIAQHLVSAELPLYYWGRNGKAEVDFLVQVSGNKRNPGSSVIPIEVKSGSNVRSRSLAEYAKKYSPPYTLRFSAKDFGGANNIKSLPLYAAFCINEVLESGS